MPQKGPSSTDKGVQNHSPQKPMTTPPGGCSGPHLHLGCLSYPRHTGGGTTFLDTEATVTLVKPDVGLPGFSWNRPRCSGAWCQGGDPPIRGREMLSMAVGSMTVRHSVWVAAVQDPWVLGLCFTKTAGCQPDLECETLSFRGGSAIMLATVVALPLAPRQSLWLEVRPTALNVCHSPL